jgi:nickel-type superoxide dismutase maturation protease
MRLGALIAPILAVAAAIAARRWLDVVEVRGRSMAPTVLPGDRLLIARLPGRPGDVVLAADPREPGRELIKRVASIDAGRVTLRGDNPAASTDARTFGSVAASRVRWRVVARYWPLERAGGLRRAPTSTVDEGGETACTFPQALIAGE